MPGGKKEQIIRVVLDISQHEREAQAMAAANARRAKDRTQNEAASSKAVKDTAKEEAVERTKLERDLNALLAGSAKQRSRGAKDEAAERSRLAREVNTLVTGFERDQARERRQAARDKSQADKDAFRTWKQAADVKHNGSMLGFKLEKDALNEQQKGWKATSNAIMGGVKSVGMFALAMAGVNSAGQVLNAVLERFQLLRERALEQSHKMTEEATDLRRLSALEGHLGAPSLTQASQLKLRAQTMQTAREAEAMTSAAKASGFGAIAGGRVSADEFDKFLVSQGRLQTLTGAEATAVGNAAGLMPMISGKEKNSAKDLENLSGRLFEIQRLGGFRDYGQSATQLGQSSGYVMKGIYSAPETQALLSAFAIGGEGDTASERLTQLTRATSANMMRNRKMNLGEDYKENSATSYQYFKSIGVNDQTAPIERAMKVVADVQKQEDLAKAAGKEFYGTDYLARQGFNSVQDREAILKLVGVSRTGMLDQLMAKATAPIGDSTEMQSAWNGMMADPTFQQRASDLQTELANKTFGAGKGAGTFHEQMLSRAYAEMGGEGGNGGYTLDALKHRWPAPFDVREIGGLPGSLGALEWKSQHMTLEAARRAGVAAPDAFTRDRAGNAAGPERFLGWEKLYEVDQKTRAAGGAGALGAQGEKLTDAVTDLTKTIKEYGGIPGPGAPKAGGPGAGKPIAAPPPQLGPVRQ